MTSDANRLLLWAQDQLERNPRRKGDVMHRLRAEGLSRSAAMAIIEEAELRAQGKPSDTKSVWLLRGSIIAFLIFLIVRRALINHYQSAYPESVESAISMITSLGMSVSIIVGIFSLYRLGGCLQHAGSHYIAQSYLNRGLLYRRFGVNLIAMLIFVGGAMTIAYFSDPYPDTNVTPIIGAFFIAIVFGIRALYDLVRIITSLFFRGK